MVGEVVEMGEFWVSGRRPAAGGYIYASSTAGLFYFMNRNISRDNWTRGAVTAKLSAYGAVLTACHHTKPYHTAHHRCRPPLPPHREPRKPMLRTYLPI